MKILDIPSRLPYPLTDGAVICMYQLAHALASHGHEVHVVTLDDTGEAALPLEGFVRLHRIAFEPMPNWLGAIRTLFDSRPYTQAKRELHQMYDYLDRLQEIERFDLVIADEIHVANYGSYMKRKHGIPYLLRTHNIEHEIYRRHLSTEHNPLLYWYVKLQGGRWELFERDQMAQADVCCAITERDRQHIQRLAPGIHVETIPAAVDIDSIGFTDVGEREEHSLLLLGDMVWRPNRDAAIWFSREILPLIQQSIPDVVCYIVGGNPPVGALPPASDRFQILGRVPSIREYFARATLGLIPLRVGGGMRVKMVEMMGAGLPIVSTLQGAEGNEARPDEHYLQADSPEEFARSVVALLRDRDQRRRLSQAAREFVTKTYSTCEVAAKIESLVEHVVSARTEGVKLK